MKLRGAPIGIEEELIWLTGPPRPCSTHSLSMQLSIPKPRQSTPIARPPNFQIQHHFRSQHHHHHLRHSLLLLPPGSIDSTNTHSQDGRLHKSDQREDSLKQVHRLHLLNTYVRRKRVSLVPQPLRVPSSDNPPGISG